MMDGEIFFADATHFKTIKGLVDADLTDRSPWFKCASSARPIFKDLIREPGE